MKDPWENITPLPKDHRIYKEGWTVSTRMFRVSTNDLPEDTDGTTPPEEEPEAAEKADEKSPE